MKLIIDNWHTLLMLLIFLVWLVVSIIRFKKMSSEERYQQIRGWLLQAVMFAEKEFGGGTGELKLSNVYAEFCKQLPWLAKIIPFQIFSDYVDDALLEMKELLEKNAKIASVIEVKEEN